MLLKRIEAKTVPEALARVRAECGDDALLVETKATARGVVVIAARPEPTLPRADRQGAALRKPEQWTRGFAPLAAKAAEFGLSERMLRAVENALLGTRVALDRAGDPALPRLAARVLAALVKVEPRVETPTADDADFRAVAFVGPTGVGKTTTLAKLAARAAAAGRTAAVVTLDTWRVAAVEQLRAFTDMLDLPLEVAFTPQDLRRALQQHAAADRLWVDTTGRSPHDRDALQALAGALGGRPLARVLCLGAGTRRRDADAVLDAWERVGIDAVCLTKWDETLAPGEALAAVVERGLPVCHLAIGQEVPADILPADAMALARAAFDCEGAEVRA